MSIQSRDCNQAAAPQELSLAEMGKKLHDAKMVVKEQVDELNSVKERSMKRLEKELNPVKESLAEMEKELHQAKMVVKEQVDELNSVIERSMKRLEEELNPVKESLGEMEGVYNVILKEPGLADMEKFYKKKIDKERSAHKETEEEFKSFKDRVAGEVSLTLKTGNSENMNNPVNETRLKEMYKELRKDWAKIKPKIKQAAQSNPEQIRDGIQRNFQSGAEGIEQKKKDIASVFNLNADSTEASQKVHELTKLTIQSLQLAVYHSFKDTAAQEFQGQEGETNLLLKCRWLSSLLALNNPPLQPDWKNHDPGQDAWNLFPQEIRAESAMSVQGPDMDSSDDSDL